MIRRSAARIPAIVDSWRFWTVLAYGCGIIVAWFAIHAAGDISSAKAERRAQIAASYTQCVQNIPFTAKINRFFRAQEFLARTQLRNSVDMHMIATPGTDVYRQQAVNIRRLREAVDDVSGIRLPERTRAMCTENRDAALRQAG